jgi:hypothetical protein
MTFRAGHAIPPAWFVRAISAPTIIATTLRIPLFARAALVALPALYRMSEGRRRLSSLFHHVALRGGQGRSALDMRPARFVTKKIVAGPCAIKRGEASRLKLGNIAAFETVGLDWRAHVEVGAAFHQNSVSIAHACPSCI